MSIRCTKLLEISNSCSWRPIEFLGFSPTLSSTALILTIERLVFWRPVCLTSPVDLVSWIFQSILSLLMKLKHYSDHILHAILNLWPPSFYYFWYMLNNGDAVFYNVTLYFTNPKILDSFKVAKNCFTAQITTNLDFMLIFLCVKHVHMYVYALTFLFTFYPVSIRVESGGEWESNPQPFTFTVTHK